MYNLVPTIAVNKILDLGWFAHGNKTEGWSLTKDRFIIRFDIGIAISSSCVWVGRFKRRDKGIKFAAAAVDKKIQTLHCDEAHELLGHLGGEDRTRAAIIKRKNAYVYGVCNGKGETEECPAVL